LVVEQFLTLLSWSPPIISLLSRRCPSTIAGLIVAVVFLAVDAQFRPRARPQVFHEAIKSALSVLAVNPSTADSDAATTVILKALVARVLAPVDHVQPTSIFNWMIKV
jgi:hypothetical protein